MSSNPGGVIFSHVDADGDLTEIRQGHHQHLHLYVEVDSLPSARRYVGCLNRDAVAKLRTALGEWLQPQPASNPITAADAHPIAPEGPEYCTCAKFNGRVHFAHGEDAPVAAAEEPPTAPECGVCGGPWSDSHGQPGDPCQPTELGPYSPCPDCGHPMALHLLWSERKHQGCTAADGCTCPRTWRAPEYIAPPLVESSPKPAPPAECTCTHQLVYSHGKDGCTYSECTCTFTVVRP